MMVVDWQQIAIAFLVAGAVAYLVYRLAGWRRRKKACAECRLIKGLNGGAGRSDSH